MRRAIRAGIVVGLALLFAGSPAGAFAQEESETTPRAKDVATASTEAQSGPSKDVFEPGAASMEPEQAIEEDPGTKAHRDWVESIWNTP